MKQGCGDSMEEDCLIVLDVSGSMDEEGKRTAGEYLLRAIAGFIRDSFPGVRCRAYAWGEGVAPYGDRSVSEGAGLDAEALTAFVAAHQGTPIILISDGNFMQRDGRTLAGLHRMEGIRAVMVGADANRTRLQKIVGQGRVFESADAVECARQLLQR